MTSVTSGTSTLFSGTYDTLDQTQPAAITEQTGSSNTTHVFTHTALGMSRTVDNGAGTTYAHDTGGTLTGLVDTAGKHHNAITDYQGSVLALVDDTGTVTATYGYTPYGFNTSITGPAGSANRLRWLGSFQLASSEYLTGYRHYSPVYARFTQPDPTRQEDDCHRFGSANNCRPEPARNGGCVPANRKVPYLASGTLALAAVVCAIVASTVDVTALQYIAIGLFCAAIASLAPLFSRRA